LLAGAAAVVLTTCCFWQLLRLATIQDVLGGLDAMSDLLCKSPTLLLSDPNTLVLNLNAAQQLLGVNSSHALVRRTHNSLFAAPSDFKQPAAPAAAAGMQQRCCHRINHRPPAAAAAVFATQPAAPICAAPAAEWLPCQHVAAAAAQKVS